MALADQSIKSSKVNWDVGNEVINAAETTTSLSYTDLATVGPDPTITTTVTQDHLILFGCRIINSTTQWGVSNVAIGGAAPDDTNGTLDRNGTTGEDNGIQQVHAAAQTSPKTHTQKYLVSGGTGTFSSRRLSVMGV